MIHYGRILELHDEGISLRGIAASTGHSRQTVTQALAQAETKGLVCPLDDELTDKWMEEFLFAEESSEASGRQPLDFEYIVTIKYEENNYEAKILYKGDVFLQWSEEFVEMLQTLFFEYYSPDKNSGNFYYEPKHLAMRRGKYKNINLH